MPRGVAHVVLGRGAPALPLPLSGRDQTGTEDTATRNAMNRMAGPQINRRQYIRGTLFEYVQLHRTAIAIQVGLDVGDHWSPSRSLLGGLAAAFLARRRAYCRVVAPRASEAIPKRLAGNANGVRCGPASRALHV
eukprot:2063463-Prymnesium_polylepis.1